MHQDRKMERLLQEADEVFHLIKDGWYERAKQGTNPGDVDEYPMDEMREEMFRLVTPKFLRALSLEPIQIERQYNETTETFATWYEGLTYRVVSKRDNTGQLYPISRRLVYSAPQK